MSLSSSPGALSGRFLPLGPAPADPGGGAVFSGAAMSQPSDDRNAWPRFRWEVSVGDVAMFAVLALTGGLWLGALQRDVASKADVERVVAIETRQTEIVKRIDRNDETLTTALSDIRASLVRLEDKLDRRQ